MRRTKFLSALVLLALLLSADLGVILAEGPMPSSAQAEDGVQPTGMWVSRLASRWETPWQDGRFHKLAVWTYGYCYGQEYLGPGGYQDTCSSSHGCIDQWTWWILYPESKLGVPFSWWLEVGESARRDISNYRATCWLD